MKKYLFLLCTAGFLLSCNVRNNNTNGEVNSLSTEKPTMDSTQVMMIDSVYNFGKIAEGENVSYSFRFKNVGDKPLIIAAANASCGCTVPEKPEAPIKPGETGYLKVVFNSQGRVGPVDKQIDVRSNASPSFPALLLKGEVVLAEK